MTWLANGLNPVSHWTDKSGKNLESFPWIDSAKTGEHFRDCMMTLKLVDENDEQSTVAFKVNCAPVMAESSKRQWRLGQF